MATRKNKQPSSDKMASWKPGSESAKGVENKKDFGVPAGGGSEMDRQYTSENTKISDPGATQAASWEHDGVRDHGAGVRDSGTGSGSGGDLDTDILGFTSHPAERADAAGAIGGDKRVKGTIVSAEDTPFNAEGPDAANNPAAEDDDSFAGEVSRGEGRGEDNP